MLWHRMRGLNRAYYSVLVLVVSGFYWLYLMLLESLVRPPLGLTDERYVTYYLAAICALAVRALNSGTKSQQLLRSDFYSNHSAAVRDASVAGATILLVLVATKDLRISRLFLFSFLPLLYIVLFFCHRFLPTMLVRIFFSNGHMQKTLLVGPIEKAERIENWYNQMSNLGLEASCFFEGFGGNGEPSYSLNPVGLSNLERIVRRERIAQVVLLELPAKLENLSEIVGVCNRLGSRLLLINNLAEIFKRRVSHFNLSGLDLITVIEEPLEDPVNRLLKRAMDIMISGLVVSLVLPPLALLVAVFQRCQSPGPLFFLQTRSGRGGKPFRIIKFRTMSATNNSPARQATRNDERVYLFGRWLRKTSLDEIPQFINVLRGEMSVVGPRPHMIVHNRRFEQIMASYRVRAFIKPGITGIAQVSGYRGEARTDREILERVKRDIAYVENWSLWQDFVIVIKTFIQVIKTQHTAY
jgi:exopolysaccharide biosynthesis polyprenyl glycosylphosphotransferase